MKISFFAVLLCLSQPALAVWMGQTKTPQSANIEVLHSDANKTVLKLSIYGFDKENVQIEGKDYSQIQIPGLVLTSDKGLPALPTLSNDVMIPNSATKANVVITNKKVTEYDVGVVAPSKGSLTRNIDALKVPYEFSKFYQTNESYPSVTVGNSSSFQLRDIKGLNVQINPVSYNASTKKISVIEEATIEIQHSSARGAFKLLKSNAAFEQGFASLYKTHFINYNSLSRKYLRDHIEDTGKLLIISHEKFMNGLKPYIAWKNQRGLLVKTVSLEKIGSTYQQIKSYIQDAYDKEKISYVILVGDIEFVPTHLGTSGNAKGQEADPMYTLVDGNDTYPDMFISRFSVKTEEELDNVVTRSVNYEKSPDYFGDWYSKGLGVASQEGAWSGLKDYERADLLRDMMLKWHYTSVGQIYEPNDNAADVHKSLNSGTGFINYIGHGSETSWGTTGFSNSDIDRLQNDNKLPFIVSVACVNGNFGYYQDSFAERWLKAGTASAPKGALSIFASSTNQEWVEPTVGQKKIVELLVAEKMNTLGSLFFHGSIEVLKSYSSNEEAKQTFETWHIFGDATVQVRTQTPTAILVSDINISKETLTFTANTEAGISVAITDQDGALVTKGLVNKSGTINLPITEQDCEKKLQATFTGFNKVPYTVDL